MKVDPFLPFAVDHKTQLGDSSLPETLTGLLKTATTTAGEAGIPSSTAAKAAVYELLRVGANVCSDHGELLLP